MKSGEKDVPDLAACCALKNVRGTEKKNTSSLLTAA